MIDSLKISLSLEASVLSQEWISNTASAFSLLNSEFFIYDFKKREKLYSNSGDCDFSSICFNRNNNKIYSSSLSFEKIFEIDPNKKDFNIFYEDNNNEKRIKKVFCKEDYLFCLYSNSKEMKIFDRRNRKNIKNIVSPGKFNLIDFNNEVLAFSLKMDNNLFPIVLNPIDLLKTNELIDLKIEENKQIYQKTEEFIRINNEIRTLKLSKDNNFLGVSTKEDAKLYIYDLEKGINPEVNIVCQPIYKGLQNKKENSLNLNNTSFQIIKELDFQNNGELISLLTEDNTIRLFNINSRKIYKKEHKDELQDIRYLLHVNWNPKGNLLMVCKDIKMEHMNKKDEVKPEIVIIEKDFLI